MKWSSMIRSGRVWKRRIKALILLIVFIVFLDAWFIAQHRPTGQRVRPQGIAVKDRPKVFIASIHRNTEPIVRSYWSDALLDLITYLGAENVFVSIYESGSVVDDTKGALADLDDRLMAMNVSRSIVLDPIDQLQEVGRVVVQKEDNWIWTRRQKYELRRIPYLAGLRNRVMAYLYEQDLRGQRYDYILWINDVVFNVGSAGKRASSCTYRRQTEDITTLLHTNNGVFDSACAIDFKVPHMYYDTFALRDIDGSKPLPITWPYFTNSVSRQRLINLEPMPVKSCWNGIVAMKAAPFYNAPSLRFRGISDSLASYHLEGSECCLIHADNNGPSTGNGVWVNPNVRVGYTGKTYKAVNPVDQVWPESGEKIIGMWRNRWQRFVAGPKRRLEASTVRKRVREWKSAEDDKDHKEHGEAEHCLINEMQVLESAGWRHL